MRLMPNSATIFHDQRIEQIHHRVSEQGDPMITYEQGGVVIIQDGGILGGIGVGGIIGLNTDDKLACSSRRQRAGVLDGRADVLDYLAWEETLLDDIEQGGMSPYHNLIWR
jgi:hypothetical protein